ncbi:hypothetical protein GUJ93_ZPchr2169g6437 [Zizania palustris]|uniref:Uncharacterized protein n=1 Tax=Zizania palustris TaxID=103762 RepID=A0A8J5V288_ZIZPA|nr:hypothetical protein GUJ93_ZPchr2169g6437 [Zizania palustris]
MSAIASAAAASSSALEGTANTTSQAEQTRRLADVGAEKLKDEPLEGLHVDRLPVQDRNDFAPAQNYVEVVLF